MKRFDQFGYSPYTFDKFEPLLNFLYKRWWRVKVKDVHNIPSKDKKILVANHAGVIPFDGLMIKFAVEKEHPDINEVRPLIENYVYYLPYLGTLFQRLGCVRADPANAEKLLKQGKTIAVFPEGIKGTVKSYSERYNLQRFGRGGFIKLAIKTKSKIIPVAIVGSEETYPLVRKIDVPSRVTGFPFLPLTPTFPLLGFLGLLPLPSRWFIRFGKPLDLSKYSTEDAEDEIVVNNLTEEVRAMVQKMVYDLLRERKSVWFG